MGQGRGGSESWIEQPFSISTESSDTPKPPSLPLWMLRAAQHSAVKEAGGTIATLWIHKTEWPKSIPQKLPDLSWLKWTDLLKRIAVE